MNVLDTFGNCVRCVLLLWAVSSASAAADQSSPDAIAREYQTHGQAVFDVAASRLLTALSTDERRQLGTLVVNVVPSRDPLRVQLEQNSPDANRLVVSVGFLILQDLLVDASVVGVVSGTEPALIDYSVEIGKFALQANYPAKYRNSEISQPKPFWQNLGWTSERYATFRNDPKTKELVSRATMQTHAWLVAYAIAERLEASEGSDAVLGLADDLLVRARFAPVPALGPSVLFSATRHPDAQQHTTWICDGRSYLRSAIFIGERDRKAATGARQANIDARITEWQRVADVLDQKGQCPD